jgi:serine protease AprX
MAPRLPIVRIACCLLAVATFLPASQAAADARHKVDPWVLERTRGGGEAEFLLVLAEQADVSRAKLITGKEAKGRYVFEKLRETAARSQPAVVELLEQRRLQYRQYRIANMIWVSGKEEDVLALAGRPEIARVAANPSVPLEKTVFLPRPEGGACPAAVSSGVAHTGAPALWAQGIDGTGAVVAGADTGYDWDHPALQNAYRGWNGSAASHAYNWHDAIHTGGGICGANSPQPCDDDDHGTHTMGTMLGDNGTQIMGMAPGARWMACRNMDRGNGTPARYAECYEFFLAPTDANGQNPDPTRSPDVINNSWGCPASEGCTDPNVLRTVVENVRAAGILVVSSAGNSGSGCGSVSTPSAIYDAAFTVGSTNDSDLISGFSSRGAVTVDGSNRQKPDISAPGEDTCSTVPGGGYSDNFSGTSMASPHVAGLVALLIDAQPCLRGEVDAIENYIKQTAVPRTTTQNCGGVSGMTVPNNTYGWGAIRAVLPGPQVCPAMFADGFESGGTGAWSSVVQ